MLLQRRIDVDMTLFQRYALGLLVEVNLGFILLRSEANVVLRVHMIKLLLGNYQNYFVI